MERRFTEDQVSEIIRRAAELSGEGGGPESRTGVSESELRRIAAEIGLPSSAVEAAIRETGQIAAQDTGGDLNYERTFERRIDGEVGEEGYATLVEHFVPEWGIGRGTTTIGNMLTYRSMVGINSCQVSVSQKVGRTTLKVTSNSWVAMMATLLPATILSIVSGILLIATGTGPLGPRLGAYVAVLVAVWIAALVGNVRLVRFSNKKVARLVDSAATDLADSANHLRSRLSTSGQSEEHALQRERLT